MDNNVHGYLVFAKTADTSTARKEAIDKGLGYIHALAHYGLLNEQEVEKAEETLVNLLGEQVDVDIFTDECENKDVLCALTVHINGGETVKDIFIKKNGQVSGL